MNLILLRQVHGHGQAVFAKEPPIFENMANELAQFDKKTVLGDSQKSCLRPRFLMEQWRSAIIWTIVFLFAEQNFRLPVDRNFDTSFESNIRFAKPL